MYDSNNRAPCTYVLNHLKYSTYGRGVKTETVSQTDEGVATFSGSRAYASRAPTCLTTIIGRLEAHDRRRSLTIPEPDTNVPRSSVIHCQPVGGG